MKRTVFFSILVTLLTTTGPGGQLTAQPPITTVNALAGPAVLDDWGNRFTLLGASVSENALRTQVRITIAQMAMFDAVNAVLGGLTAPSLRGLCRFQVRHRKRQRSAQPTSSL